MKGHLECKSCGPEGVFITDSESVAFHTHRAHRAGKDDMVLDTVASDLSSPSSLVALVSDWLSSVDAGHRQRESRITLGLRR